ncbi:hypothetical protein TNCV_1703571 [Trichonephila clavipes]|nr:hypothetical protein TNCV_1703571 [Trichonephila clavipes]
MENARNPLPPRQHHRVTLRLCRIAGLGRNYNGFQNKSAWTVGSLVVRASDSRPESLDSMPHATKYPSSTHGVHAR